jgi:uncharacterized protein YceK
MPGRTSTLFSVIVSLVLLALVSGCSTAGKHAGTQPGTNATLSEADIDALTGPAWIGTLTYLDYTSRERTTIDSSLIVRRTGDSPPSWEIGIGYSKEPQADSSEVISLTDGGRILGDEHVISRESLPGGGVRFVTEADGEDDHRPSRFRFEHTLLSGEYSRRKLVRFKGQEEFFERHVYRWVRQPIQ